MKNKVISNLLVAVAKGLEAIRQIVRAIEIETSSEGKSPYWLELMYTLASISYLSDKQYRKNFKYAKMALKEALILGDAQTIINDYRLLAGQKKSPSKKNQISA
jgi:hypothetical protein